MRTGVGVVAAATALLGVSGCGDGDPGASTEDEVRLTIADFAYEPASLSVAAGGRVLVTNRDDQPHTITSDVAGRFDTGSIAAGGTPDEPLVITEPGTHEFHCSFHPFMHGTVVVR